MSTPAGIGPLALLTFPVPAVMGADNDVAAYGLAARLVTPPDAPAEWGETAPVACLDLRAEVGARFDAAGRRDLERRCNEVLRQDLRVTSVSVTLDFTDHTIVATVAAYGARGPFTFVLTADKVSATLLRSP